MLAVFPDRKRARLQYSTLNQVEVPPPPPKRPNMCVKLRHHLITPATIDILTHGWRSKGSDGRYTHTWLTDPTTTDNVTPTYIPDSFDILGEKLDKAFLDLPQTPTSCLSDILFNNSSWKIDLYTVPLPESLELKPLFSEEVESSPPPPPHRLPEMEAIGDQLEAIGDQAATTTGDQLENSQYSPTHTWNEDYKPPMREDSKSDSSEYLSADDEFPPPAPSPPSYPSSPGRTQPARALSPCLSSPALSPSQSSPHCSPQRLVDDYEPQFMDLAPDDPMESGVQCNDVEFSEEVVIRDKEEDTKIADKVDPEEDDVEDIDSPDELEVDIEDEEDTQISLYRDIVNDAGQVSRVLYFRKSKFRCGGTAQHHLDKMRLIMDYRDACKGTGYPDVLNKTTRPLDTTTLSDRIENPKKKLPLLKPPKSSKNFGISLVNLTRNFRVHDASTSLKMKSYGIPMRRVPGVQRFPHWGSGGGGARILSRSERLLTAFCPCWVQRPFHDSACATSHDEFVEIILKRHSVEYSLVKESIREYLHQRQAPGTQQTHCDPVRNFASFKRCLAKCGSS